jgi:hypothetical protein
MVTKKKRSHSSVFEAAWHWSWQYFSILGIPESFPTPALDIFARIGMMRFSRGSTSAEATAD